MRHKTFFCLFLIGCAAVFCVRMSAAEDELREKALLGDAKSEFALGNEYFYGTETRKANPVLAAHWFRKASDEIPEAMYNYGFCLEQGMGVDRDPVAAAECYRKAAEKCKRCIGIGFNEGCFEYSTKCTEHICFCIEGMGNQK